MRPVITVYYHGSGGRYLSIVAQALIQPTKLVDPCSGHLNPSIPMLEFTLGSDRSQYVYILQNAWQELQNKAPSPIVHSQQQADLNLLLCALPNVNFLHITAEPDDAADLAYNWYYKNLSEIEKGNPNHRDERIQRIQAQQLQYKNFMLSDPVYNINPDIFDNVEMTNCEFWATITAEVVGKHIRVLNSIPKTIDSDHRIFEISWKDLKAGLLKNRLLELANIMGIELLPDRQQNALEIIEQWTANQPRASTLNFSTLQKTA